MNDKFPYLAIFKRWGKFRILPNLDNSKVQLIYELFSYLFIPNFQNKV